MPLDLEAARAALSRDVAQPLGLSEAEAAAAILRVATRADGAARSRRSRSTQGIDPGARGAGRRWRRGRLQLGRDRPAARLPAGPHPCARPALSAAGALISDLSRSFELTLPASDARFDYDAVNRVLAELQARAEAFIAGPGEGAISAAVDFSVEARYPHQVWELEVPVRPRRSTGPMTCGALSGHFHAAHQRRVRDRRREVADRVPVAGTRGPACTLAEPAAPQAEEGAEEPGTRDIHLPGHGTVAAAVWRLGSVPVGEELTGPAIVEMPTTTVLVDPGAMFTRRASGTLRIVRVSAGGRDVGANGGDLEPLRRGGREHDEHALPLAPLGGPQQRARLLLLHRSRRTTSCVMGAESLPIHMMSGPDLISRAVSEAHPDLRRGDAFLHNSPYHGNSHAADHSMLVPVVDDDGVHHFSVLAKAHQADCGNSMPTTYMASATDVYEEGALIFDAFKVQADYEDLEDVLRALRLRIRVPDQWWGDYLALLGAVRIGERRVLELGREFGWDGLDSFVGEWFDYSERAMARAIEALPSGQVSRRDPARFVPGPARRASTSGPRSRCGPGRGRSRSTSATTPTACRTGSTSPSRPRARRRWSASSTRSAAAFRPTPAAFGASTSRCARTARSGSRSIRTAARRRRPTSRTAWPTPCSAAWPTSATDSVWLSAARSSRQRRRCYPGRTRGRAGTPSSTRSSWPSPAGPPLPGPMRG